MFVNYGDKNFFEYGRLVDTEHSDTEISVLYCMPYDDWEDLYECAKLEVDIEDDWINRKQVCDFCGLDYDKVNENPVEFALACIDYYGAENFGAEGSWLYKYDWRYMTKEEILEAIKYELIDYETVEIS